MKINEFFKDKNLDDSLILGFYGGSNYGDELLLEVIQHTLHCKNYKNISLYYTHPKNFHLYHKDYGFEIVGMSKLSLLKSFIKRKKIILGGGGFWGLDFGMSTFLMSIIFFIARFIFMKKVYLVGVGYYDSASVFAKIGAFFAGLGANAIIARDAHTYRNFSKIPGTSNKLFLDSDIALVLIDDVTEDLFDEDVKKIEEIFEKSDCDLQKEVNLIGLRRFSDKDIEKKYLAIVEATIKSNDQFSIMIFENVDDFTVDYEDILDSHSFLKGRNIINFNYNPLALYFFFKKYRNNIKILTPQFHVIMIAIMSGVSHEPIAYDYKVFELLRNFNFSNESINKLYK